jgi:hypothetical protein
MEPKLRPRGLNGHGIGDIKNVKGADEPVPSGQVKEMVRLLLDSLPTVIYRSHHYPVGELNLSMCRRIEVQLKFINRNTTRTNAGIQLKYGTGVYRERFCIRFYPTGLNERTIIHEVAHIPSWGDVHGSIFKFWQAYLQAVWYGEEEQKGQIIDKKI